MARIKVTIWDDDGGMINKTAEREYELNVGKGTLAEIEGAVDDFKKKALVEIEKVLLVAEQDKFVEEQKKRSAHV
jgi:hypothetical protein